MERKLLALDLDGTLTNSKKEITPRTKKAIHTIQKMGHMVVLASGRPTPGVAAVAEALQMEQYGGFMLSYNGGIGIDCRSGEILYQRTMPKEVVPELFAMAKDLDIGMMTYQHGEIVSGQKVDDYMRLEAAINGLEIVAYDDPAAQVKTAVNKCLGTAAPEVAAEIERKFAEVFGDRIDIGRSEPFFIELLPKGVNKASSLEKFRTLFGFERENIIACGDGFNDQSMIQYAGLGVAMANAQEVVKKSADYVTEHSNDEDGIAEVIEKFILETDKK